LIGVIFTCQKGDMADPKGSKVAAMVDGARVQARNAINMVMDDLVEVDRREMERELEELAEIHRRKLACFQKTRNSVLKKSNMAVAPSTTVNSHLSPEDLMQMVDVSVASKYGADLTQFTWVMAEDMRSTFNMLKQDLSNYLSKQVRALVQQINGEAQRKCIEGTYAGPNPNSPAGQGNPGTLANANQPSSGVNLNMQQPFYQTMACSPNMPPTRSVVPHGPMPDVLFPRTLATNTYHVGIDRVENGSVANRVSEQIARTLREFGFAPKGCARAYQKPYPEYFNTIPYPRSFRVPDFTKFNIDTAKTTYEHVGQFLAHVNDIGITDVHKVRLFLLSLSGTAFNWFTSLALNSVDTWPSLEQKFHDYFYNGEVELRLSDLTGVRQRHSETVPEYLKRFRETRN
jgi:hypothetical protein